MQTIDMWPLVFLSGQPYGTDMNNAAKTDRKDRIAQLAAKLEGLKNDARYWDLRRTYGDYSREVLLHLESCARAQKVA